MEIPKEISIGDCYNPAIEYAMSGDKKKAAEYYRALIVRQIKYFNHDAAEANRLEQSNIGYYAGYFGEAERRAVNDIYGAVHPIFGNDFAPSADKALEAGKRLAHGEFDGG